MSRHTKWGILAAILSLALVSVLLVSLSVESTYATFVTDDFFPFTSSTGPTPPEGASRMMYEETDPYATVYSSSQEDLQLSAVKSVEYVEITLGSGTTNASASLSKSQTIANCVPFVTSMVSGTSDDWDDILADIYFETGPKVAGERSLSGGTVYLGIFVVEFDSNAVRVQQGAISFLGTLDTDSITAVDQSKAAVVFYYKNPISPDDWDHSSVAGWFSADNTLSWQRDASDGTIEGHFYVFEALGTEFSVQAVSFNIPYGSSSGTATISSVTMSKTFVVASYRTNTGNDDADSGAISVYLNSATEVKAERYATTGAITDVRAFAITFSGDETVQRGTFSYASGDSYKEATLGTSVDTNRAMAWNPNVKQGCMMLNTTFGPRVLGAFQRLKIVDNGNKVRGDHTSGSAATGKWEVIEWVLADLYFYTDRYPPTGSTADFTGTWEVKIYVSATSSGNTLKVSIGLTGVGVDTTEYETPFVEKTGIDSTGEYTISGFEFSGFPAPLSESPINSRRLFVHFKRGTYNITLRYGAKPDCWMGLTTGTVVPEKLLGLLFVAPFIPLVAKAVARWSERKRSADYDGEGRGER